MINLHGRCIKHTRNKDVAYVVTKAFDTGNTQLLKAFVINLGYKESWPLNVKIGMVIKNEDLVNWHYCKDVNKLCLRNAEWARIKHSLQVVK